MATINAAIAKRTPSKTKLQHSVVFQCSSLANEPMQTKLAEQIKKVMINAFRVFVILLIFTLVNTNLTSYTFYPKCSILSNYNKPFNQHFLYQKCQYTLCFDFLSLPRFSETENFEILISDDYSITANENSQL